MRRLLPPALILAPALTLALALSAPIGAQTPPATPPALPALATLVADNVTSQDHTLVATGHVVVLYKGSRLTASKVTYDSKAGTVAIDGPLTLLDADGKSVAVGSSADLSSDMQNGILHSAKLVLDKRVEISSDSLRRVDGRYAELNRAVASSCEVCPGHPVPLWEIRARRIVHDSEAHKIYFSHATLRFWGVPVVYLPQFALNDPTVKRARGFLFPRLTSSTNFGFGFEVPYFLPLGPSRDLTLVPFVASKSARSLTFRYREAFNNGALAFRGAISRDKILPGKTRGYLLGSGNFNLRNGFLLRFQVQQVSDPAYFINYGLTQIDRLETGVELSRTRHDEYIDAQVLHFHSIRGGEDNATLPTRVASAEYQRRFVLPGLGGQGTLGFRGLAFTRSSQVDVTGRDVSRAGASVNWQRSFIGPRGLVFTAIASAQSDVYAIANDSSYPNSVVRTLPQAALQLSWPLVRSTSGGASEVLTPVAQLIFAPRHINGVPNEDSVVSDFDEGNLFSLSHFNGVDGVELGNRANVGVTWTRYAPSGLTLGVAAGRIFRSVTPVGYDPASGLSGKSSDWLVATQARYQGLGLINRLVFGGGGGLSKDELRFDWSNGKIATSGSYLYMAADPAGYPDLTTTPTREVILSAGIPVRHGWSGSATWRYDAVIKRNEATTLNVNWNNECVSLQLSLSRSYASSTSVTPNTTFGFSLGLIGFGAAPGGVEPGSCRR